MTTKSAHKISIRSILFGNGQTKKIIKAKKRKLEKKNALPTLKEIRRNSSKESRLESYKSLKRIFSKDEED